MTAVSQAPARALVIPGWGRLAATGVAILIAGVVAISIATISPPPAVHAVGLFVHLAALVVGFGAVLHVEWVGLLWLLGRRESSDILLVARTSAVPIWGGYAGLALSGLVLEPELANGWTLVKLGAVIVIGLNGVVATGVHEAMERSGESARLFVAGTLAAVVSQTCWWTATVIGFINAH